MNLKNDAGDRSINPSDRTNGNFEKKQKVESPARVASVVIQAHYTIEMSALLASSFVGRVAAFKATKVQVRIS